MTVPKSAETLWVTATCCPVAASHRNTPYPLGEIVSPRTGWIGSPKVTLGATVIGTPVAPLDGENTTVADGPDRSTSLPVVNKDATVAMVLPAMSLIPAIDIVCTVFAAISPVSVIVRVRLPFDKVRAAIGSGLPAT